MALAKGTSRIRTGAVTLHTQTAIHIAEQLTQVRYANRTNKVLLLVSELQQLVTCKASEEASADQFRAEGDTDEPVDRKLNM